MLKLGSGLFVGLCLPGAGPLGQAGLVAELMAGGFGLFMDPDRLSLGLADDLVSSLLAVFDDLTSLGGDIVQAYGGRVVLAELIDGFSTTATIERLSR